jgi:lycopene cyclase domain-containing protein
MSLYSIILIASVSIPLILSFDRKVNFYRIWPGFFPASVIIGSVYIVCDIFFVKAGIWGFNPHYHSNILLAGLPLEEWLFFLIIPYACLFIHYVFVAYFPGTVLPKKVVKTISISLIILLVIVVSFNFEKTYTSFNFILLIISLFISQFSKSDLLGKFYLSFLIILVPFFIVDSILTGSFIPGEVVWYNNNEILGIRLLTVPIEDFGYALSLILLNLLLTEKLLHYFRKRINHR